MARLNLYHQHIYPTCIFGATCLPPSCLPFRISAYSGHPKVCKCITPGIWLVLVKLAIDISPLWVHSEWFLIAFAILGHVCVSLLFCSGDVHKRQYDILCFWLLASITKGSYKIFGCMHERVAPATHVTSKLRFDFNSSQPFLSFWIYLYDKSRSDIYGLSLLCIWPSLCFTSSKQ